MRKRLLASLCAAVLSMLLSAGLVAAAEPELGADALEATLKDLVATTGTGGTLEGTILGGEHMTVRLNDDGDNGDVVQSNSNESGDATATNGSWTSQSNDQGQAGTGGNARSGNATGGTGVGGGDADSGDARGGDVTQSQAASNDSDTSQQASAKSEANQIATNDNVSIRIFSDGDDGNVTQSNSNQSGDATATNVSKTDQSNDQAQAGTGGDARSGEATGGDSTGDSSGGEHAWTGEDRSCGCQDKEHKGQAGGGDADSGDAAGGDVDQSQSASNTSSTTQQAEATSTANQIAANKNVSIRLFSDGDNGDVRQTNSNESGDADATNLAATDQSNHQGQAGTGGNAKSGNATGGDAGRSWFGGGSGGDADSGNAYAGDVDQLQAASNSSDTSQAAGAWSKAEQQATNQNLGFVLRFIGDSCRQWCGDPCESKCDRIDSGHDGWTGDVRQSNRNRAGDATATNLAWTGQSNEQGQAGTGGNARSGEAIGGDAANGDAASGHPASAYAEGSSPGAGHDAYTKGTAADHSCCGKHGEKADAAPGGDADSGNAYGGDVDQSQSASNQAGTTQHGSAISSASQQAENSNLGFSGGLVQRCREVLKAF